MSKPMFALNGHNIILLDFIIAMVTNIHKSSLSLLVFFSRVFCSVLSYLGCCCRFSVCVMFILTPIGWLCCCRLSWIWSPNVMARQLYVGFAICVCANEWMNEWVSYLVRSWTMEYYGKTLKRMLLRDTDFVHMTFTTHTHTIGICLFTMENWCQTFNKHSILFEGNISSDNHWINEALPPSISNITNKNLNFLF